MINRFFAEVSRQRDGLCLVRVLIPPPTLSDDVTSFSDDGVTDDVQMNSKIWRIAIERRRIRTALVGPIATTHDALGVLGFHTTQKHQTGSIREIRKKSVVCESVIDACFCV